MGTSVEEVGLYGQQGEKLWVRTGTEGLYLVGAFDSLRKQRVIIATYQQSAFAFPSLSRACMGVWLGAKRGWV